MRRKRIGKRTVAFSVVAAILMGTLAPCADAFAQGIDIGDEKLTLPARLEILTSGKESEIRLTIQEGRFHQVKRMFEKIGCTVTYLKRVQFGSLTLDGLESGQYRTLTEGEIKDLYEY